MITSYFLHLTYTKYYIYIFITITGSVWSGGTVVPIYIQVVRSVDWIAGDPSTFWQVCQVRLGGLTSTSGRSDKYVWDLDKYAYESGIQGCDMSVGNVWLSWERIFSCGNVYMILVSYNYINVNKCTCFSLFFHDLSLDFINLGTVRLTRTNLWSTCQKS